ncbi:group III truncated hemoglobin [Acidihalobacter prosperus]
MSYRQLSPLSDQIGRQKVDQVINVFYEQILDDTLLGPLFDDIAELEPHKKRIADFWWIAMGGKPPHHTVHFDMIGVHAPLGLQRRHFDRWLEVFKRTLEDNLPPRLAANWLQMAEGIASRLQQSLGIAE